MGQMAANINKSPAPPRDGVVQEAPRIAYRSYRSYIKKKKRKKERKSLETYIIKLDYEVKYGPSSHSNSGTN